MEKVKKIRFQTLVCYSNPASHPFISTEERNYLKAELGQIKRHKNLPSTPWKSVLTSVPVLALICGQVNLLHLNEISPQEEELMSRFSIKILGWT